MKVRLIAVLVTVTLLFSCAEKTQVNLVSGTLFLTCTDRLANFEIALKANQGRDFNSPIILGSATTDNQGSFNFTYELEEEDEGTGDIILVKSTGFETLISGVELNESLQLVLYRNDISAVLINLDGSKVYAPTDTLFYGNLETGEESFKVQPMNGALDTFYIRVPNQNQNSDNTIIYYGVGSSDFAISKEAANLSDSSYQNITVNLKGCDEQSVNTLVIN